ncbi:MAG TPA: methylmalonyl Co-A mutase-associated GTPase MeaB [Steroidobacteraceae bacterium]|nr:methylmalonyl Co-A mutase-associated GTPase MeaB [Steroidobacteraceae bacterium]
MTPIRRTPIDELVERLSGGDRRALSRIISEVENGSPRGYEALALLYPHSGRAHTIGVTGSAGSGKSTLTGSLARAYRRLGRSVGIIAVDPSSPYTQGAILGDRIRMQDLTSDPGIFMRSMATRGSLGGLAATAADVAAVLDAAGRDVILIETVGAGQDEVEIARVAQSTILVNTPGMGDDIQAIKAGIMEIADVLVVNKADLPGADAVAAQLRALLSFAPAGDWRIPILKVVALKDEGVDALVAALDAHHACLEASGGLAKAQEERARRQIVAAVYAELVRRLMTNGDGEQIARLTDAVARRRLDPRSAALTLIGNLTPASQFLSRNTDEPAHPEPVEGRVGGAAPGSTGSP